MRERVRALLHMSRSNFLRPTRVCTYNFMFLFGCISAFRSFYGAPNILYMRAKNEDRIEETFSCWFQWNVFCWDCVDRLLRFGIVDKNSGGKRLPQIWPNFWSRFQWMAFYYNRVEADRDPADPGSIHGFLAIYKGCDIGFEESPEHESNRSCQMAWHEAVLVWSRGGTG